MHGLPTHAREKANKKGSMIALMDDVRRVDGVYRVCTWIQWLAGIRQTR